MVLSHKKVKTKTVLKIFFFFSLYIEFDFLSASLQGYVVLYHAIVFFDNTKPFEDNTKPIEKSIGYFQFCREI